MPVRHAAARLWILLVVATVSGCTSVSGDGWSAKLWPGDEAVVVSDRGDSNSNRRSDRPSTQPSSIQLASWPVELPSLWPHSDGTMDTSFPSPLAPLAVGMDTLRAGTHSMHRGALQFQAGCTRVWDNSMAGSTRAWENTKRLLTPPMLTPDSTGGRVSLWQQLFAPAPGPRLPATTREFFAQERPRWGS